MAWNPFAVAAQMQEPWQASFKGTDASRLFMDWAVGSFHPDREIQWASRELRARARDLYRNNDYATGIVESFVDNIAGWEGIRCKPDVRGPDGKPVREINWEIERGWQAWDEPEHASVDQMASFVELQQLLIRTWVQDGEVFIRHREGWDNPFGYAIELIDADLLDETYNVPPDGNGVQIRMGVEMDRHGRRRAYHFFKHHPNDGRGRERTRVSAREIEHFFVRYRPGQTRGYSLFAPVLTTLKMIDGLTEAELVASRMSAATMGFITNMTPEAIAAYAHRLKMMNDRGKEAKPQKLKIAPGMLPELHPGQGFEGFDPNHPNDAFESFLKVMLRGVSRGFSISYLTGTGDVEAANYSSMRAGAVPERDRWRLLQLVLAKRFHRPVQRRWLGNSLLTGALQLPSAAPSDYYATKWKPRGWKWVDPLKDLQALALGIAIGVNSRTDGAAELGRDVEEVIDDIRDEEEYAKNERVDVSVPRKASASSQGRADEDEEDEERSQPPRNGHRANRVKALTNGGHHG